MAIADIYNSLTFGGVNSLDYGIYITGPAVFDAPTRDIEFVSVPGRNGAIEIDKGHWNNIEVTYHAGVFGDNQSDFATKINAFRNAIVSQIGYQRLTDTYNPNEYRLGLYASGLTVSAVNVNKAGEFDLVFNCKPQRYLLSGENEITVSSGQTITNPTLFDAAPMIITRGYGDISIGDEIIQKAHSTIGTVIVANAVVFKTDSTKIDVDGSYNYTIDFDTSKLAEEYQEIEGSNYYVTLTIESQRFGNLRREISGTIPILFYDPIVGSGEENNLSLYLGETSSNPNEMDWSTKGNIRLIANSGPRPQIRFEVTINLYQCSDPNAAVYVEINYGKSTAYSKVETITEEITIDCETGISYMETETGPVSTDNFLVMPLNLIRLKPGEVSVSYPSTIDYVKIIPRWWEL